MNANIDVTNFLKDLNHPFYEEIELLRKFILTVDQNLRENVKWNGPNYCYNDEDRITMRIQPPKNKSNSFFIEERKNKRIQKTNLSRTKVNCYFGKRMTELSLHSRICLK